jgi:pimeloyl-ACP methyl ester carboxylesterase
MVRGLVAAGLLAAFSLPLAAQDAPIQIFRQGSMAIGGALKADEDGAYQSCGHGFLEYQIPVNPRDEKLLFWHSSSTFAWQNNWIGDEGFQTLFLRRGYPVLLWEGPGVGRANWDCAAHDYAPQAGRDQQNFTSWRFGPDWLQWFDGVQFPTTNPVALDQAMRARYNEFDTLEAVWREAEVAAQAFDEVEGAIAVTSSAGGLRALLAATQSDNVRAIVAYENPGYLFPQGEGPDASDSPFGPLHVREAEFQRLLTVPMQFVWGDNIESHAIWSAKLEECRRFVELVNARGGKAEILMLEDAGLTGNTHMPFADLNHAAVAALLDEFLARHGLDRR